MFKNVKITTIINPLDLLAPHTCRGCGHIGEAFCDCCKKYIISHHYNFCPNCKTKNHNGKCSKCSSLPPIFVAANRNSVIGQLIKDYKYQSTRALAIPLSDILNHIIPNQKGKVIVVPLPTINKHIRNRGLDHTMLLAKKLAKLRHNFIVQKLLLRSMNTVQVGADKNTRQVQAKSAYRINPRIKIERNATYLILDDVWTTGASTKAAIKKLQQAGVSNINVAILAVSGFND